MKQLILQRIGVRLASRSPGGEQAMGERSMFMIDGHQFPAIERRGGPRHAARRRT